MTMLNEIAAQFSTISFADVVFRLQQEGYYYLIGLFIFFTLSVILVNFVSSVLTLFLKVVNKLYR
jgi:hypothetical protein